MTSSRAQKKVKKTKKPKIKEEPQDTTDQIEKLNSQIQLLDANDNVVNTGKIEEDENDPPTRYS